MYLPKIRGFQGTNGTHANGPSAKPQWFACEIKLDLGVHNIQIIASFNLKQCDYVQDTFVVTVGNSFISIYEVII